MKLLKSHKILWYHHSCLYFQISALNRLGILASILTGVDCLSQHLQMDADQVWPLPGSQWLTGPWLSPTSVTRSRCCWRGNLHFFIFYVSHYRWLRSFGKNGQRAHLPLPEGQVVVKTNTGLYSIHVKVYVTIKGCNVYMFFITSPFTELHWPESMVPFCPYLL